MKWVMLLPSIPTELNLGDRCLDGVLSSNNYESDVLKVQARWRPAPTGTHRRSLRLVATAGSPGGAEMQVLRDRLPSLWGCGCDGEGG